MSQTHPDEVITAHSCAKVVVSSDRMLAELVVTLAEGQALSLEQVAQAITTAGLPPPSAEALASLCAQANTPAAGGRITIARGIALVEDAPAHMELAPELSSEPVNEVSHYDRHHYLKAAAGQRIARIIQMVPGHDGVNVFGQAIPRGRVVDAAFTLGANVTQDSDGSGVLAEVAGCVKLQDHKLWIEPILEIPGNVDFSVGNIDFAGDVHIHGSVVDLFHVKSGGAVVVHRDIEAAVVSAGTNLIVHGGIVGRDKGHCSAGQDISLKHATNAVISAGKDVHARIEIASSHVDCGGLLDIPEGSIIGGSIRARGGIRCGTLGSSAGTKTFLEVGTDVALRQNVIDHLRELRDLEKKIHELRKMAAPLLQNQHHLNAQQKEKTTEILFEISEAESRKTEIVRKLRHAFDESRAASKQEISVGKRLYPGVTIRFPDLECAVEEPISGPIRLVVRTLEAGPSIVAISEHGGHMRPLGTHILRDELMHSAMHAFGLAA